MSGFLVPSYMPDTSLSNSMVSHPSRANTLTAVRSSDLNHKQTMTLSDLFTDTLTIKLLTHTFSYPNLQSHTDQILAEISRTS